MTKYGRAYKQIPYSMAQVRVSHKDGTPWGMPRYIPPFQIASAISQVHGKVRLDPCHCREGDAIDWHRVGDRES